MATTMTNEAASALDPLTLLRRAIAAHQPPIATSDPDPSTQAQSDVSLAQASYLIFNFDSAQDGGQHIPIRLTQPTRFISTGAGGKAIDLRSVYFTWLNRDSSTAEYVNAVQVLNNELQQAGKDEAATNLVFSEKVDLVNWLAGETPEGGSEHIKSLDDNQATRKALDKVLAQTQGVDNDVEMTDAGLTGSRRQEEESRLREIYAAERTMGDHNTVLRGVKLQDFSNVRKFSALFLGKAKLTAPTNAATGRPSQPQPTPTLTTNPALRPSSKPSSNRRPEPIILLSPSASSLLRMGNIKPFLEDGAFTPLSAGAENPGMLAISRTLRSISADRPLRFLLLDDTTNFRPDYWTRVVAVFTTGQTWQFKNYKWQNPAELFSHALGVYVGWKGEVVPEAVRGWGRQVLSVAIDKGSQRWRDREVVEDVWSHIEGRMRASGWGKDSR